MKKVIYAGSEFVTGDDIAAALLATCQALADVGEAETVSIPTLNDDGSVGGVLLLIGPASQMLAHHVTTDADEVIDDATVTRLNGIQRRLHPTAAFDVEPTNPSPWDGDL
ncbi:hypothetical protein [Microbacterium kyungheense]|uniref:Uncharacterized protein n=1 Tax=Microbacterium kyungheense TaxID=1263636 RepID=A0A543F123_9MICO|nr:hypothetical protein [Microbacterium kyungheense]TQM27528.1 hypothetical protein FB391_1547 [Microbacterium kyungheense]